MADLQKIPSAKSSLVSYNTGGFDMKKSLYKFLAAVLAAVLVFCLGACGAQAQPTQPAADAPTQAQQTVPPTETNTPTEPATDWTVYTDWVGQQIHSLPVCWLLGTGRIWHELFLPSEPL